MRRRSGKLSFSGEGRPLLPFGRRFILFLFGLAWYRINPVEPSVKIDIRAALRAERAVFLGLRADSANNAKWRAVRVGARVF